MPEEKTVVIILRPENNPPIVYGPFTLQKATTRLHEIAKSVGKVCKPDAGYWSPHPSLALDDVTILYITEMQSETDLALAV
jgi:hypothetical protein